MSRFSRALTALVATLAVSGFVATAGQARSTAKGRADSGVAYAAVTHMVGSIQVVDGDYIDKILGRGAIIYRLAIGSSSGTIKVTSKSVTLYTRTGSLSGTASARVSVSATTQTVTGGKLSLTKGAGSLKGHSFVGTFTGSSNLAANTIVFHYKGTYK